MPQSDHIFLCQLLKQSIKYSSYSLRLCKNWGSRNIYCISKVWNAGESGEITTTHMLLGIWSEKDSAGHKIMASLAFDDEKAKELAKSVSLYSLITSD